MARMHTRIYDAILATQKQNFDGTYECAVTFDKFVNSKPVFQKPGFKQPHPRWEMVATGSLTYHNRSYSERFKCPCCENVISVNTNYLGRRRVYCIGTKTEKE